MSLTFVRPRGAFLPRARSDILSLKALRDMESIAVGPLRSEGFMTNVRIADQSSICTHKLRSIVCLSGKRRKGTNLRKIVGTPASVPGKL